MTIAVMQPYIFPYLGYYQLVNAVDTFVFFDDVNFINKGWVNRNRILLNHEAFRFTIPLNKASQNKLINEIEVSDFRKWRAEFLKTLENSYKKAPCFSFFYEWMINFIHTKEYSSISELTADSVKAISELLGVSTDYKKSSDLEYKTSNLQSGQDKVIKICKLLGAVKYINPYNGMEIYDNEIFNSESIDLNFIRMDNVIYKQFRESDFIPSLSIIDVLMFLDCEKVRTLLGKYTLEKKINTDAII